MRKNFFILLTQFCLLICVSCSSTKMQGYHLVWSDEFTENRIDPEKWDFQLGTGSQYGLTDWGNNELEYYTKNNARIENGNLILEARKETKEHKSYTSARLRTIKDDGTPLFTKTYGRIEARIKLPAGNGIWPAFWMLPATDDYGSWASSGEIDILEAKGRLPNRVYGTVHYGQEWPGNKNSGSLCKFKDGTDITDYHVYALEWEPGLLRWLVDGKEYYKTSQWWSMGKNESKPYPYPAPYDKPFYILLNLAVGGNFDSGVNPDDTAFPACMYVDYIRVYDKDAPYTVPVKRLVQDRDSKAFSAFHKNADGNFITDSTLSSCSSSPMLKNEMDAAARSWYFLTLSEYGGQAVSQEDVLDGIPFRHVKISNGGNQNYAVQLIQHLPIAKGYSYCIEFDAKTAPGTAPRTIAVKAGGDADNNWAVYSPEYHPELTANVRHFSYFFTMEDKTDTTARLEFNTGLGTGDVWIGNVKVTQAEL